MKLLNALVLLLIASSAHGGAYYSNDFSTSTGKASMKVSGTICIAASSTTPNTCGTFLSSSSGTFSGGVTADSITIPSGNPIYLNAAKTRAIRTGSGAGGIGMFSGTNGLTMDWDLQAGNGIMLQSSQSNMIMVNGGGGSHIWQNSSSVERMRLTSAGFLGVGNNNPLAMVHIGPGTTSPNDGAETLLRLQGTVNTSLEVAAGGGGSNLHLYSSAAASVVGTTNANPLYFGTSNTSRMAIDSAGKVGVGNLSPTSLFNVGASDQFQVSSTGDLVKIKNVAYSWPSSQGSAANVLTNDGAGNITWAAAPGSGAASIVKYSVPFSSFSVAASTADVQLFSLPAKTMVKTVIIKPTVAFSGGAISAYTISVGTGSFNGGTLSRYASAFNVFQAVDNETFQTSNSGLVENFGSAVSVRIAATSTGANLSAAAAGNVDVYVETVTLP